MIYLIIGLGVLCLGLVSTILLYCHEIKSITQQLDEIQKSSTNRLITQSYYNRAFNQLVEHINNNLMKEHNLRIQLERHERSQQQLLTNLSHDVRTPLTSLKGYVSLLQDTDNKDDADRYITLMSNRMDRLTQLLDQLFTYNKLTDDHYSLATQTVNLSENLLTCLLNFYHQFQELDCKPNLSLPDQPVFIEANPDLIQRILTT